MIKANNLTTVQTKPIGVPITSQEKYDRLLIINSEIEILRNVFDLEIEL